MVEFTKVKKCSSKEFELIKITDDVRRFAAQSKIKNGVIHTHSEHSCRDSAMSTERLCERAAELGAPAVVLTDHGTMTGTLSFMLAARNHGIKGIPGLEAYMLEDGDHTKRRHLVLIPKSYAGYQAIAKALTKANTRIVDGFPCMNMGILREFFGEGTSGHDHVIATSACVSGVLARILLRNSEANDEIGKLEARQSKYTRPDEAWDKKQQDKLSQNPGVDRCYGRRTGTAQKARCP